MFGAAATRLSLTTIGILQYLGPIIQFIIGLTIFDEDMSTAPVGRLRDGVARRW